MILFCGNLEVMISFAKSYGCRVPKDECHWQGRTLVHNNTHSFARSDSSSRLTPILPNFSLTLLLPAAADADFLTVPTPGVVVRPVSAVVVIKVLVTVVVEAEVVIVSLAMNPSHPGFFTVLTLDFVSGTVFAVVAGEVKVAVEVVDVAISLSVKPQASFALATTSYFAPFILYPLACALPSSVTFHLRDALRLQNCRSSSPTPRIL